MNEEGSILPYLIGGCLAIYLGYEINRRRNKLRRIFNTFDREESLIADCLESLVKSGELKPYTPHQGHVVTASG